MSDLQLGRKFDSADRAIERDAIHVAVFLATLGREDRDRGTYYRPGMRVKLAYGTRNVVLPAEYGNDAIGVIDPFISDADERIEEGDRVYVFLFPGTATGLKHVYEHPVLDAKVVEESEEMAWLRRFAQKWNFDFDEMMAIATQGKVRVNRDAGRLGSISFDTEYIVAHGRDLHSREELGEDYERFWQCIEAVTGQTYDATHRESVGWSCTC